MSGVAQYRKTGPRTYTPADNAVIRGGRVVAPSAIQPGRIVEAPVGSVDHLGVALTDAIAPEDVVTSSVVGADGRPVTALYSNPTTVAVADSGIEVKVTYAADCPFGAWLTCAADGEVTPAVYPGDAAASLNLDPRKIVGQCREPLGVVVLTNPRGLMKTV